MTVASPPNTPTTEGRRFKMRMLRNEFMVDFGGRVPAGSVLVVDEETAIRWLENSIADPAPADALTLQQQKREDIRRRLEASGAETQEGVYNAAITRESFRDERIGPRPMPRGRRGKASRADLDGAEVANEEIVEDWPGTEG